MGEEIAKPVGKGSASLVTKAIKIWSESLSLNTFPTNCNLHTWGNKKSNICPSVARLSNHLHMSSTTAQYHAFLCNYFSITFDSPSFIKNFP